MLSFDYLEKLDIGAECCRSKPLVLRSIVPN
jgi:hypothetical protein